MFSQLIYENIYIYIICFLRETYRSKSTIPQFSILLLLLLHRHSKNSLKIHLSFLKYRQTMLTASLASNSLPPLHPTPISNPKIQHNYFKPIDRRHFLTSIAISVSPFLTSLPVAESRGLFQMPPVRLTNR